MRRRFMAALAAAACCAALGGCWDYRGLDELTIVAGMAVDMAEDNQGVYAVTFEVIGSDTSSAQSELKSTLLAVEGSTISEAISNAGRKLHNDMYFGNCQLMVVNQRLVSEEGLGRILDDLLRDFSTRDNLSIAVSREDTAALLLEPPEGDDSTIIAYSINESLISGRLTAEANQTMELFRVYNRLKQDVGALTLPALALDEEGQPYIDGLGVFHGDKLHHFLREEELECYQFAAGRFSEGFYTFYLENGDGEQPHKISLRINESKPSRSFTWNGEQLTLCLEVQVLGNVTALPVQLGKIDGELMRGLEARAAEALRMQLEELIRSVQRGSGADVFGFGETVYRRDPQLWAQLGEDWIGAFTAADIEVDCSFRINDTGLIKDY